MNLMICVGKNQSRKVVVNRCPDLGTMVELTRHNVIVDNLIA
jgi:hypothetical protein